MERLTIKNSDGTYSQPTHTTFNNLFDKLSKLEDVLEKYGIESVEELDKMLGNTICRNLMVRKGNIEV